MRSCSPARSCRLCGALHPTLGRCGRAPKVPSSRAAYRFTTLKAVNSGTFRILKKYGASKHVTRPPTYGSATDKL
jgi:hypothetical protein